MDSSLRDMLADAYSSTEVAAKLFYPERFSRSFSPMHKEMMAAMDDPEVSKMVIAAPRGIGKTSIVQLAYPTRRIVFRDCHFMVTVSKSAGHAQMQSEALKRSLTNEPIIKELFGNMESKSSWSQEKWIVDWRDENYTTLVLPRGGGQPVRGLLHDNHRPDLIIIDDFEDDEEVLSEDQRKKKRDWFYGSLVNIVDRGKNDWKIIYIDTVKHEDCLLNRLLDDKGWTSFFYTMGDDSLKSNWPEFINDKELLALHDEYKSANELDKFYMEYYNVPISSEESGFGKQFFRYYDPGEVDFRQGLRYQSFVIIDPAKTVNPKSAYSAILGGTIDFESRLIYFRDLINARLHPNELYSLAIDMYRRMRASVMAVEVTSLNEYITYPFNSALAKVGIPPLKELKPRDKKEMRAKALIPFYRGGQILHNMAAMMPLEQQLLSFPRPRNWDCIDVAAYVVELFEHAGVYFGSDVSSSPIEAEHEFDVLGYDTDLEQPEWAPDVSFDTRMVG